MAWSVLIWKIYEFPKVILYLERFVLKHATAHIQSRYRQAPNELQIKKLNNNKNNNSINMQNEIISLLLPLGLIIGGFYVKNNPDKEPFASKNTWKWFVVIGSVSFVLRLVFMIVEYI